MRWHKKLKDFALMKEGDWRPEKTKPQQSAAIYRGSA